jgi:major membrane immunogen (membrane-anchored lipoprotein)
MATRLTGPISVLLVLTALLTACGDDDDGEASGDIEAYCALVAELDEAGSEAFAPLEEDDSATEEDFAAAELQFIEDHADDFDDLRDIAPDEIAEDIETLLDAQEDRASGGEQEEASDEASEAEERVVAFEEENCSSG